ncbi:MAG TPA: invasion associated locus B family protein [Sphingomicrobium sp.]|nr:invasion associated locus B family protein [Sphingomicrobium sp.]
MRARLFSLILGGGALLIPAAAQAEELGNFGAWYAFTQGEGEEKLCYMIAAPIQSQGDIPNRGEVGLMVTHQMGGKVRDQVSVALGFEPHKTKYTKAKVDRSGNVLMRLVDGDRAWIRDSNTDRQLVARMKRGDELVVTGMTSNGIASQDTFSLDGFTRAYAAISLACGVN